MTYIALWSKRVKLGQLRFFIDQLQIQLSRGCGPKHRSMEHPCIFIVVLQNMLIVGL